MTLNKDALLAKAKLREQEVDTPVGSVLVREWTARQRDQFEQSCVVRKGKGKSATVDVNLSNIRAKAAALSIIDPDTGDPMFDSADEVGELPAGVIQPVFDVVQRLNGLSDDDVEELAGNSESAPPDDS